MLLIKKDPLSIYFLILYLYVQYSFTINTRKYLLIIPKIYANLILIKNAFSLLCKNLNFVILFPLANKQIINSMYIYLPRQFLISCNQLNL